MSDPYRYQTLIHVELESWELPEMPQVTISDREILIGSHGGQHVAVAVAGDHEETERRIVIGVRTYANIVHDREIKPADMRACAAISHGLPEIRG